MAGRPEELEKIPAAYEQRLAQHPLRWISLKGLLEGTERGRASDREVIAGSGVRGGGEGGPSQGTAFASVGGLVYHLARERGLGREIPTEWFLQDIRN